MKVLFLNIPNKPFTEKSILIEPIDILYLASYIEKKGHSVDFLDMDVKQLGLEDFRKHITQNTPDILVLFLDYHIPLHKIDSLDDIFDLSDIAKEHNIITVVWGKIATYLPEKLLFENSSIDIAISYDMELALEEICNSEWITYDKLEKINNISYFLDWKLQKNPINKEKIDLDMIPKINYDLVDLDDYIDVRTIFTSRGCNIRCAFCATPNFWWKWAFRSPEIVVDEIENLVNRGASKILFLDDNATIDISRMETICKLIISKNLNVKLGCLSSLLNFDEDTMKIMYKAGFRWIHYGIECGDESVFKAIQKPLSIEKIKEVIKKTKKIGFRIRTSWILDLPNMGEKSLDDTVKLILGTQTDEIRLHHLSLRLGSSLADDFGWEDVLDYQYIHGAKTKVNLTKMSEDYIMDKRNHIVEKLRDSNYFSVESIEDNAKFSIMEKTEENIKVVAKTPLKYWISW